jgi:hypothetical protein
LSLPRPTKEWPYDLLGPWAFREVFYSLVDPGDIYPPHLALAALKNASANSSRTTTIEFLCTSVRQQGWPAIPYSVFPIPPSTHSPHPFPFPKNTWPQGHPNSRPLKPMQAVATATPHVCFCLHLQLENIYYISLQALLLPLHNA